MWEIPARENYVLVYRHSKYWCTGTKNTGRPLCSDLDREWHRGGACEAPEGAEEAAEDHAAAPTGRALHRIREPPAHRPAAVRGIGRHVGRIHRIDSPEILPARRARAKRTLVV